MSSDLKGVNFVVEPSQCAFGRASPLQTLREQHLLSSPDTTAPTSHGHDSVPGPGQRAGRAQLLLALTLQPLGEGPCLTQEAKDPWRDRRFKVARPGCGLTASWEAELWAVNRSPLCRASRATAGLSAPRFGPRACVAPKGACHTRWGRVYAAGLFPHPIRQVQAIGFNSDFLKCIRTARLDFPREPEARVAALDDFSDAGNATGGCFRNTQAGFAHDRTSRFSPELGIVPSRWEADGTLSSRQLAVVTGRQFVYATLG